MSSPSMPNYWYSHNQHGTIQNRVNGESITFLLNPKEFQVQVTPHYGKLHSRGGTYETLHYEYTGNPSIPLTLVFARYVHISLLRGSLPQFEEKQHKVIQEGFEVYRRFLLALCYPVGNARDQFRRSPPSALLMWPDHVAMEIVLEDVTFTDNKFDMKSRSMAFKADLKFTAIRSWRLTSENAFRMGFKQAKEKGV